MFVHTTSLNCWFNGYFESSLFDRADIFAYTFKRETCCDCFIKYFQCEWEFSQGFPVFCITLHSLQLLAHNNKKYINATQRQFTKEQKNSEGGIRWKGLHAETPKTRVTLKMSWRPRGSLFTISNTLLLNFQRKSMIIMIIYVLFKSLSTPC